MRSIRLHCDSRALRLGLAASLALAGTWSGSAVAATTVTPVVSATGRASDNTGMRAEDQDPREDVLTTVSAGGQLYWTPSPIAALRISVLGEYERYLSAAVKNTYATGGLDGRWRPDERTTIRSSLVTSYAPDRYDPRVPYRMAIASSDSGDLPPFVRATTTRVNNHSRAERWFTETIRGRIVTEWDSTRYSNRRSTGSQPTAIESRSLEGRNVAEGGLEGLRNLTEIGAIGLYARYAHADYEIGPTVHTVDSGALTEWEVTERWSFMARTGVNWSRIPGDSGVPTRIGWSAETALSHHWEHARVSLLAREGVRLTSGAIPAAQRREGRFEGAVQPWEKLEARGWFAAARERSMFAAYRATGTADILSTGASLGWKANRYLTLNVGAEHNRLDSTGLVDLPYRSNVVFLGLTFVGGPIGDVPPGTRYPPVP